MTNPLDRMNLRPFEKRLVVGIAVLLFIVFNAVFVFPHFSDWGKVQERMAKARFTLTKYENEVSQKAKWTAEVAKLQGEGLTVPQEDQAVQFSRTIQSQADQSGVGIQNMGGQKELPKGQFFLEKSMTVSVQTGEPQLVDFLYRLGSGNSLIRVRGLTLRPDAQRQALGGSVTLVASYQNKVPAKSAAPAAARPASTSPTPATTAKPAPAANKPATPAGSSANPANSTAKKP